MKIIGHAPRNMRGKHTSIYRKLNKITKSLICYQIKISKDRQSHYSLKYLKKSYFPDDLTLRKRL